MIEQVQAFVDEFAGRIHPAAREAAMASWESAVTGSDEARARVEQTRKAFMELFTQPEDWEQVRGWYEQRESIEPPQLRRQLEVLYLTFAGYRNSPEHLASIAALEAELASIYNTFRCEVDGKALSENEILEILSSSSDQEEARAAWEGSKQIGPVVADQVRELVRVRNEAARLRGARNYYLEQLALQEIDETELFRLLDELEQATREPFRELKQQIDERLAARYGIPVSELQAWHYADPFFQQPPKIQQVNLDEVYAEQDLVELALRSFDSQGLEVRDILDRSDLFEREGKNQHAFCIHIDRATDDVRILCNLRPTTRWMDTLLHELGHAIYNKYLAPDMPYLLRRPAHTNTTEAIAMLMGRQAREGQWLERIRRLSAEDAQRYAASARAEERLGMIVFIRWALVMVHFERALYADPDNPDLNKLWWDYVEHFQLITPPAGRAEPDWASKIHIALYPVYYHNYILGELTASQIQRAIEAESGDTTIAANPTTGTFLRERLFVLGGHYPWNETLRRMTGSELTAQPFVDQFVKASV